MNIQFRHTQSIASQRWLELVKSSRAFLSSMPVRDMVRASDHDLITSAPSVQFGWDRNVVDLLDGQVFHAHLGVPYLSVACSAGEEALFVSRDAASGAKLYSDYGNVKIGSELSVAILPSILLLADHVLPDHFAMQADCDIAVWKSAKALLDESVHITVCLPRSLFSEPDVPSFMDYRA